MPQYRKLYTKSVESLDINDMTDDTMRLAWVLLPLALCSEGRGLDNPAWLKAKLFPLRMDVTLQKISECLDWWSARGMIQRYEVDGRKYFCIPTWHEYQKDTSKEAASPYPAPLVDSNSGVSQELVESGVNVSESESVYESESLNAKAEEKHPIYEMLEVWSQMFPNKPQPRPETKSYRDKVKTRWKSQHFRDNWFTAMSRAARSPTCQSESWFSFEFFVRDDKNYQKCLDSWMDWKDKELREKGGSELSGAQYLESMGITYGGS